MKKNPSLAAARLIVRSGKKKSISKGAYLVGPKHSEGGIKVINKSNPGQKIEVEGGEAVITAPALADDKTLLDYEGKKMTKRQILSDINVKSGGNSFAKGGRMPKKIRCTGKQYKYGGKLVADHDIVSSCGCKHSQAKMAKGGTVNKKPVSKKIYTHKQLETLYNFKTGYDLSYIEAGDFESETFTVFLPVYKLRGEYPNFERDPKFKGFIFDPYKAFIKVGNDKYQETDTYRFEKGGAIDPSRDQQLLSDLAAIELPAGYKAYQANPVELRNYIQDQATGMDEKRLRVHTEYVGYKAVSNIFGKKITLRCVAAIPQDKKQMIIKAWKGKALDPELRKALRAKSMAQGGYVPNDHKKIPLPSSIHSDIPNSTEYNRTRTAKMAKGGTIKDKVMSAADQLKEMTTHTQLREWAISNGMDNRSAFPKFKEALNVIGLDYDKIKTGIHSQQSKELIEKIKYSVTLYVDAKASAGKFGITDQQGNVLWYGRFFDDDNAGEQSRAELAAAKKAVWLASKIKEAVGEQAIELLLFVDAQWLTYQDHGGQKGYALTQLAKKYNIKLSVEWISGKSNPADKWTTASGYKKWSDNDLKLLAETTLEGGNTEADNKTGDKKMNPDEVIIRLAKLRKFVPTFQVDALADIYRGEEGDYAAEIIQKLIGIFETMPKTYQTQKQETSAKIVYLHYFYGSMDWYIVERDSEAVQYQAFGYADFGDSQQGGEWGYISLVELMQTNKVEIDFGFQPIPFGQIPKYASSEKSGTTPPDRMFKVGDKVRLKPVYLKKEPVMKTFNEATISELSDYYTPETGYMYDTVISQDLSPRHFYESEIELIPATGEDSDSSNEAVAADQKTAIEPIINQKASTTVSQQGVINAKIRSIIYSKADRYDRSQYSAEELSLLKQYEGAGSEKKNEGEVNVRILDQFFTPMDICAKMWGMCFKHGFTFPGSRILEPAVGSGRFLSFIPADGSCFTKAFDLDEIAVTICKVLYPHVDTALKSFETMFFQGRRHIGLAGVDNFYDLVIGNPPYRDYVSEYAPLGEKKATGAATFEMYFVARGVDVLKPGGLLCYIIPNTFLSNDNKYNEFKENLAVKCDLVDAYRLPNGVFGNTDVGTDIILLKKKK